MTPVFANCVEVAPSNMVRAWQWLGEQGNRPMVDFLITRNDDFNTNPLGLVTFYFVSPEHAACFKLRWG
jgi:hypothetical protein